MADTRTYIPYNVVVVVVDVEVANKWSVLTNEWLTLHKALFTLYTSASLDTSVI